MMNNANIDEILKQQDEAHKMMGDALAFAGWFESDGGRTWIDPLKQVEDLPTEDAYNYYVVRKLKENGWKQIKEIRKTGVGKFQQIIEWGRFQSPTSKKVYTFFEAEDIMRSGWDENVPLSGHTEKRNELIGDNFSGDEIRIHFRVENGEPVWSLWQENA